MPVTEIPLSVVIPAHNPDPVRLRRTFAALRAQTLHPSRWECVLVDNASTRFPDEAACADVQPANLRRVREDRLGLTHARRRGLDASAGAVAVLVDDDNVLAPDYLENVLDILATRPRLGAIGGKSLPEFEAPAPEWTREFHALLALRDLGEEPIVSGDVDAARLQYPLFAPLGAGMAIRRAAWLPWRASLERATHVLSDRRGAELTSSGDNDMVLCALRAGWQVGYFPQLRLIHLIPRGRVQPDYLARLNRGIQKSWMQVLAMHDASPWPPLSPTSAALRKAKAWFAYRAWSSPQARIRWQGACGHFDGRVPRGRA